MDLTALEYPRHVHRPSHRGRWTWQRVESAAACADALAAGWSLEPMLVPDDEPLPELAPLPVTGHQILSEAEDEPLVIPRKRGRPPKVTA